jgi:hypothetical protein
MDRFPRKRSVKITLPSKYAASMNSTDQAAHICVGLLEGI